MSKIPFIQNPNKSFIFNTTKSIICENNSTKKLGEILNNLHFNTYKKIGKKASVLIITDDNIIDSGIETHSLNSLIENNYEVNIFSNVKPDPPEKNILDACDLAKQIKPDLIIGFGGGSPMDVAKVTSYLSHPDNSNILLEDCYGVDMIRGDRLPLIQIPTTAGTGSEVTPISIITTGEKEKKGIVSNILLPDLAILDGSLTITLPLLSTAYCGIDAMVHAIEAYTSKFKKNLLSDLFAREALKLLGLNLRIVHNDPNNVDARTEMLLGSLYAGISFANSPVGAVHALAYPIGSLFKVPHGLSNSLMLPHIIRYNAEDEHCAYLYSELAPIVFPDLLSASKPSILANSFASSFDELANDLSLPTSLTEVGIQSNDLQSLVDDAMKQTRLLPNNPREIDPNTCLNLYQLALNNSIDNSDIEKPIYE